MKKAFRLALLLVIAVYVSGCASTGGYFADRGRDAADIFTATIGVGAGVKARVGPIQVAPLLLNGDVCGVLEGIPFISAFTNAPNEYLAFNEISSCIRSLQVSPLRGDKQRIASARRKLTESQGVFIFDSFAHSGVPARYFDIEVAGGLLVTARLGFNPAEMLDFFLGWFNVDILADDIAINKKVPSLVRILLNHVDKEKRRAAAEELSEMAGSMIPQTQKEAVRSLAKALNDTKKEVRQEVAWALVSFAISGIAARGAIPALIAGLKDDNSGIRSSCADALGYLGLSAKDAVPSLINMLRDTDSNARKSAAEALGKIDPEAKDAISVSRER